MIDILDEESVNFGIANFELISLEVEASVVKDAFSIYFYFSLVI